MIFDPILDIFRGKAVTIPPMDGALKPNTVLDDAPSVLEVEAPDNLCSDGERLIFSSGEKVFALDGDQVEEINSFDATCCACWDWKINCITNLSSCRVVNSNVSRWHVRW